MSKTTSPQQSALTVTALNNQVKRLLEHNYYSVWVQGELSNFSAPVSGHWYFSLKDDRSQLRAAMFKQQNRALKVRPKPGDQVLVLGRLSLYAPRGDYQMIVEQMIPAGRGDLHYAFEQLKLTLGQEGLFDEALKVAPPQYPNHIGIVSSKTGAALRDIVHVLQRRCPATPITLYPTSVQGGKAAQEIVAAIGAAHRHGVCDVLIVARGGGSIEDLWPFNEASVARAIAASRLPIISGVGHQTDFTIADLVADVRAPTPSAAAELVGPDQRLLLEKLLGFEQALYRQMQTLLSGHQHTLTYTQKRLKHPGRRLEESAQRLDELFMRLRRSTLAHIRSLRPQLDRAHLRLQQASPAQQIGFQHHHIQQLTARLQHALRQQRKEAHQQWESLSHRLHLISPLATLKRGYSITQDDKGQVIRAAATRQTGEAMVTLVEQGTIHSTITRIVPASS